MKKAIIILYTFVLILFIFYLSPIGINLNYYSDTIGVVCICFLFICFFILCIYKAYIGIKYQKYTRLVIITIMFVLTFLFLFILSILIINMSEKKFYPEKFFVREYKISSNKKIVIDNWDCGATCLAQISLGVYRNIGFIYLYNNLLTCEHIDDVELIDINEDYAVVSRIRSSYNERTICNLKEGLIIYY